MIVQNSLAEPEALRILKQIYPDGNIAFVKRFGKGMINKSYETKVDGEALVLRVYPKDFWKIKKEKHLYNLLSEKTDVPVPEIIKSGRNYLLMSRIEGNELSVGDKRLVRNSGELLAKIHSIKFDDYGWIIYKEPKPMFKRWEDFICYDLNLKFGKLPERYAPLKKRIKGIIGRNSSLLDVGGPCLLHKDYHSSHIITGRNKVNGIIDIEWAISGHNEFDIAKSCLWMFDKKPASEKEFLRGYKRYGVISGEFAERKRLYRVIHLLSSFSFSYEHKNRRWCIYNLDELKRRIGEYSKSG